MNFHQYFVTNSSVKKNAKTLGNYLIENGYKLVTDGTDNHLILVDLRDKGISGSKVEYLCEKVDISLNKNSGSLFFLSLIGEGFLPCKIISPVMYF